MSRLLRDELRDSVTLKCQYWYGFAINIMIGTDSDISNIQVPEHMWN